MPATYQGKYAETWWEPTILIGAHEYPPSVELTVTSSWGEPTVFARFEIQDQRPVVTELRFTQVPGGQPVREAYKRKWRVEGMASNTFTRYARLPSVDGRSVPAPLDTKDDLRVIWKDLEDALRRSPGPCDFELQHVADVYSDSIREKPLSAVQFALGYPSFNTARNRVACARSRGFLPPTTQGRRRGKVDV